MSRHLPLYGLALALAACGPATQNLPLPTNLTPKESPSTGRSGRAPTATPSRRRPACSRSGPRTARRSLGRSRASAAATARRRSPRAASSACANRGDDEVVWALAEKDGKENVGHAPWAPPTGGSACRRGRRGRAARRRSTATSLYVAGHGRRRRLPAGRGRQDRLAQEPHRATSAGPCRRGATASRR